MRENIFTKGRRLFGQGRVRRLPEQPNYYEVQGDHGTYEVRLKADGSFNCGCDYNSVDPRRICSHVVAAILSRTDEGTIKNDAVKT